MKPQSLALIWSIVIFAVFGALFPDYVLQIIAGSAVFYVTMKNALEKKETKRRKVKSV